MTDKKTTYSSLLKDPRWQKKRLEIMQRDKFSCQICGDEKSTLNVHHCFYQKGNKPWDYPDESLVTLCETCHSIESDNFYPSKNNLTNAIAALGATSYCFDKLAQSFCDGGCGGYLPEVFFSALAWKINEITGDSNQHERLMKEYFERLKK